MNPIKLNMQGPAARMTCAVFTAILVLFIMMPPFESGTTVAEPIEDRVIRATKSSEQVEIPIRHHVDMAPMTMKPVPVVAKAPPKHAPEEFSFTFQTTKGNIQMKATKSFSPLGVEQLYQMILEGFFNEGKQGGIGIFRCVPNFVLQFGIHGDPAVASAWGKRVIQDDPKNLKNERGTLTFATSGPNTRTTQLFLNLKDNSFLDNMGFTPLAKCVSGCDILDKIEMKYAEKPNQGTIQQQGNTYLKREFPDLDYIIKADLII
eukprot:m.90544 g.90544  ORF g.90544 m.90544 type:complete len:262 (+) comp16464_c0_seq2:153-938(+)